MTGPKLGLIGKPNVGKSTIFSAMTEGSAEIGNYPFTTTKPNLGVAYFPVKCPHTELGTPCNPREGYCREGTRYIPVRIIDVPGLIEGASQGKGMGNEFLENVRDSDAILLIYDASGHTAMDGSAEITAVTSPEEEIRMVLGELDSWLVSKLGSDWDKFARKADSTGEPIGHSIQQKLSSYGVTLSQVHAIIASGNFPGKLLSWGKGELEEFSRLMFSTVKPVILVGNKADLLETSPEAPEGSYFVSGDLELALSRASRGGLVTESSTGVTPSPGLSPAQISAVERMTEVFSRKWVTRIRELLGQTVRDHLKLLVVYPVYDDRKWTDKEGNILPDAFLMPEGTTAESLAFRVHTDIGNGFIKAINCRTGMVIGRDHSLEDGDIIRIISKS